MAAPGSSILSRVVPGIPTESTPPEEAGLPRRIINTVTSSWFNSVGGGLEFIGNQIGDVAAGIADQWGMQPDAIAADAAKRQQGRLRTVGKRLRTRGKDKAAEGTVKGFGGDVLGGVGSLGAGPLSALSEAQSVYEEAIARGVPPEQASKAAQVTAVVNTTLDTLSLGKILSPFVKPIRAMKPGAGALANAVRASLEGSMSEGITESMQSVVARAALESYDEGSDFFDEQGFAGLVDVGKQALREGLVGVVVGGGVSAIGGAVGPRTEQAVAAPETATEATQETEATPTPTPGPEAPQAGPTPDVSTTPVLDLIPSEPVLEAEVDYHPAGKLPGGRERVRPRPVPEVSFEMDEETRTDLVRRYVQDRFLRIEKVQAAAAKQGGEVGADEDALTKAQLNYSRAADRLDRNHRFVITPFLRELADSGITPEEFGDFLYAEHAPIRNARLREIRGENLDGLSGMSDGEARLIMTRAAALGKTERMKALGQKFRQNVVIERIRIAVREGLMSEQDGQRVLSTFEDGTYVPLIPEKGSLGALSPGRSGGKGFSVSGPEGHRLKGGMFDRRENPFVRSIIELEKTIQRAEKNKVARAFLDFALKNPNEKLYRVQLEEGLDPGMFVDEGMEFFEADPNIKYSENVMTVKVGGKQATIEFLDQGLASAFKNLEPRRVPAVVRAYANFFRTINTVFSPTFIAFNFVSDFQTALFNATGEADTKAAGSIAKNVIPALKGVFGAARERSAGIETDITAGDWKAWAEKFNRQGGRTGFFVMDLDLDTKVQRLRRAIRRHNSQKAIARNFENVMERTRDAFLTVNEAVEGASRVAFFRHMVERGMSEEQAALAAKNLTVNFDRKGEWGAMMNSWYVFSNASIQGTTQMLRALKRSPQVRQAAAATIVGGMALAAWNSSQGGDDYDELVKTNPELFERYLPLLLPDGSRLNWRMPYGFSIFAHLGQVAHAVATGKIDTGEGVRRLLLGLDAAFNPLNSANLTTFVLPTMLDPIGEIGTNTNFMGGPIQPAKSSKKPSQSYFKTASPMSVGLAKLLSEWTGGVGAQEGFIEVSPEVLDHIATSVTGAVGREVVGMLSAATDVARGQLPEARDIPIWRRIHTPASDRNSLGLLYDMDRGSTTKLYGPEDYGLYLRNVMELSAKKSLERERAMDFLTSFTRNQARLIASGVFPQASGKAWENRVEIETRKLRNNPVYRRAHAAASRLPQ